MGLPSVALPRDLHFAASRFCTPSQARTPMLVSNGLLRVHKTVAASPLLRRTGISLFWFGRVEHRWSGQENSERRSSKLSELSQRSRMVNSSRSETSTHGSDTSGLYPRTMRMVMNSESLNLRRKVYVYQRSG